jgi:Ca2+-binding EF-hand superfamily protein
MMGWRGPNMMGWRGGMMGWQGPNAMGWQGPNAMGWRGPNMMGWRGGMMGWHGQGRHHMSERIQIFAERYDTNGDGKITQVEIDTNRADWFKKYDTNHDGKLSIEEYQALWLAAHHRQMVRSFQRLDVEGAGAITEKEYQAPLAHIVDKFDRNNDGVLSYADVKARRAHPRGPQGMWRGGMDGNQMPMMDHDNDDDNAPQQQQQQPQQ